MVHHKNNLSDKNQTKTFKRSLLAMCVVALAAPSFAQTPAKAEPKKDDALMEEVVITGMRDSLQSAQDIKRKADTVVDSITANDIGALPDRSVLEAMQRLPGVSIERFASSDDPDHFSVEGSGAVIRGMTATRSEFNGRDSFTANSGRGLSWQDIPPELMAGVDLYKNQTADMIEGGIGGTVSLRTRKPFDSAKRLLSVSGDVTWGDIAQEATPTISALYSDRWDTEVGEFGFLLNIAQSELTGTSHGIQADVYKKYDASKIEGAKDFVGTDGKGTVWMPQASNFLMKEDERERNGQAMAVQWRDPNDTLELSLQYMRSDATLSWWENALKYQGGYTDLDRSTRPVTGTQFVFDGNGIFQSGYMANIGQLPTVDSGGGWRGTSDGGHIIGYKADGTTPIYEEVASYRLPSTYNAAPTGMAQFGNKYQAETRGQLTNTLVEDTSFNIKWTPDDAWEIQLDYQNIHAETKTDDLVMHLGVSAMQKLDVSGDTPTSSLVEPWGGKRDANPALFLNSGKVYPGFTGDPAGDSNYFQDIHSYWYRSAMDHYERSEGDSNALRFDVKHMFEDMGLLTAVKGGVRWSEREQVIGLTSYNWGSLAPEFSSGVLYLDHVPAQANSYEAIDWSNFQRGGVIDIPGGSLLHPTRDYVTNLRTHPNCDRAINKDAGIGAPEYSAGGSWLPYACRTNVDGKFGLFRPDEISNTTETNNAAYVRVDFGSDEGALRYSGNVGLRYAGIEREADGYVVFPELFRNQKKEEKTPTGVGLPKQLTGPIVLAYAQQQVDAGKYTNLDAFYSDKKNAWVAYANNYLPEIEQAFGGGSLIAQSAENTYSTVLPSVNLKVELTDDLLARVAVSKAIALPDMELLRHRVSLGSIDIGRVYGTPTPTDEGVEPPKYETALQSAYVEAWNGTGGNPFLKPMESIQYDATLEWYFGKGASLTNTLFYKDLSNFFVNGAVNTTFTDPVSGVVQEADVAVTRNGGDGSMAGWEIAYSQFFDFLPAPYNGLGMQANYTYIEASGVPNNEEGYDKTTSWIGGDTDTGARVSMDKVPLQGQSKHTFNLVAMYEKDEWSARLAYNWRSRYLLTTRDVISKYPLWNDKAGFLDGSVFYKITPDIKVGLQMTNLLNTQSKTIMILDGGGAEAGRSWFIQDRRASLVFRANF
jgi:iron complex outermembrane recepter protein